LNIDNYNKACGERIKTERKRLKLTQKQLADSIGLAFGTVSKYENGSISIPAITLYNIANFLGVSADYLLGITDYKEYLEQKLSAYYLSEDEYNLISNQLINEQTIDLSLINNSDTETDRITNAYNEIFNTYLHYLESNCISFDVNLNEDNVDLNLIKQLKEPIDLKFLNIMKSLDKNKFVYSDTSTEIQKKAPILKRISPELPLFASEDIENYDYIPNSKIQKDFEYFFLRMTDDSMDIKIPKDSLLLIQKQEEISNKQIGVFRINNQDVLIRKFKEDDGLITLEPWSKSNEYDTQVYNPRKTKIEVIGIVLSYSADI